MNTIFSKIDPSYLECITGTCGHVHHMQNMHMWFLAVALILYSGKYYHANYKEK